jgi:hypothetical protein
MSIHCGHCQGSHGTVSEVRACATRQPVGPMDWYEEIHNGSTVFERARLARERAVHEWMTEGAPGGFTEQDERDMQRMEAEGDREETRRDEANKFAARRAMESAPDLAGMQKRVIALLESRTIPASEKRWGDAIRHYVAGFPNSATEYGLLTAIERLESYPERASRDLNAVMGAPVTQEGLYRLSRSVRLWDGSEYNKGDLFQVVYGRDSSKLYAKLVELPEEGSKKRPKLMYAKGIVFQLLPSELVSAEEAQEITRKTGWCVFGHFLTNPVSIARGMGPVCWARYGAAAALAAKAGN